MRNWMRSAPVALGLAVAMGSNLVLADEASRPVVSRVTGVAADPAWEEEYAYSLGVQAYVFAFPWYYNQLLRWLWVTQPPRNERTPSMPLNSFWHARYLTEGDIVDHPDGSISFLENRAEANMVVFRLGVSVGIPR